MTLGNWPYWLEWTMYVLALYGVSHLFTVVGRWLVRLPAPTERTVYYVVWTSDSAQHVEYWLRRIHWAARLTGRDYRLVWRDDRSADETGRIVERMTATLAVGPSLEEGFSDRPAVGSSSNDESGGLPVVCFVKGPHRDHSNPWTAVSPAPVVLLDLRCTDEVSDDLEKV